MRIVVAEPPRPLVLWEDADAHLKLDGDVSQQSEVESMIAAATSSLEGPDGWLGRSLAPQTVDLWIDGFDCEAIGLPLGPVMSIDLIEYRDPQTGEWMPIDPAVYEQRGNVASLGWRQRWPLTAPIAEAVQIRYQAGYTTLPKPIRAAILLMVGDLYSNRETVETGVRAAAVVVPMSTTVEALLMPYRLYV